MDDVDADDKAVKRGSTYEGLAILLDTETVDGLPLAGYHRWSRAVWSTLDYKVKLTSVLFA